MITNEEKVLFDRVGQENPFRVPEGYFEALPQRVLDRITRRRQRRRIWEWAAAAIMAGCVCTAGLMLTRHTENQMASDDAIYMQDELDYSMVNNLDIQQYLTVVE